MAEVWWEVRLTPCAGDGYLRDGDVDLACGGIPDGASVELVLSEFDDFSASAVGLLARRLMSVSVRLRVEMSARGSASAFSDMFDRAQQHYLVVEAGHLAGRTA